MLGVPPQKLCRDTQQVIIGEDIEENKSKYVLPAFTQLPPVQTFNFQELSRINNYILFCPCRLTKNFHLDIVPLSMFTALSVTLNIVRS